MISGVGVRNVVENKVDLTKSRNLIIIAVILVTALGCLLYTSLSILLLSMILRKLPKSRLMNLKKGSRIRLLNWYMMMKAHLLSLCPRMRT